ncbi:MAG: thioredoxin fold domain-containing protein [Pseudomonadota bacterium]
MPNFAAKPPSTNIASAGYELVVFERARTCLVCRLFRRDVAENYMTSQQQTTAPMRFIDLDRLEVEKTRQPHPGLTSQLRMLPTVVIMRDGREQARVEGYTGPAIFYQAIRHALGRLAGRPDPLLQ